MAVIVEPAHPARIAPLLMSAYGLTEREQELDPPGAPGIRRPPRSPSDLVISVHTVQQHLKSVFDKTGVRSRRDLVTKVFLPTTSRACATTSVEWQQIIRCVADQVRLIGTDHGGYHRWVLSAALELAW